MEHWHNTNMVFFDSTKKVLHLDAYAVTIYSFVGGLFLFLIMEWVLTSMFGASFTYEQTGVYEMWKFYIKLFVATVIYFALTVIAFVGLIIFGEAYKHLDTTSSDDVFFRMWISAKYKKYGNVSLPQLYKIASKVPSKKHHYKLMKHMKKYPEVYMVILEL